MSKKLIALVPTAVVVDGVRTVIQPGEELPGLGEHDEAELVKSGAAEDPAKTAAAKKVEAKEAAAAAAEFEEARARVKAEAASTAAPAPPAAKTAKPK
jgi:hypothetical protein